MIKGPDRIFIQGKRPLLQTEFDAVCKKIVLPDEVKLLDALEEFRIEFFEHDHSERTIFWLVGEYPDFFCC